VNVNLNDSTAQSNMNDKGLVQVAPAETPINKRGPSENVVAQKEIKENYEILKFEIVPVIPSSLKDEILSYFHASPEFGHFGRRKTIESIKRRFFWNFMNKEIAEFVKVCPVCQKTKNENFKRKGLMGFTPVAEKIFETIYIDFVGPLVPSKYGKNRYILVLVEQLSGWVEVIPMRTATSQRVIDFLEDLFCRYGTPKAIISDNGSNFTSRLMKIFCKERAIKHILTSAYRPCANRSERSNKDIVRMIASFIDGKHTLWDMHLQQFALALRTAVNETTGVTPALLFLGREINLPIDRSLHPEMSEDYVKDAREIAKSTPAKLQELIKDIRENISHVQQVNKFYFDEKCRNFQFKEGDRVWVRNNQLSDGANNISKKLCAKWIGPYKIVLKRDLTYYLNMPKKFVDKRHVSDLKPYYEPKPKVQKPVVSLRQIVTVREPEVPLDKRLRPRKPICYAAKKK